MKVVACEMCGCKKLLKEDGLFVCQACGTMYTVEESRKLLIEETVEITGLRTVNNEFSGLDKANLQIIERKPSGNRSEPAEDRIRPERL